MSAGRAELVLGYVPPSLNRVGARGAARAFHRAKKSLEQDLAMALLKARVPQRPQLERVEATVYLTFATRRRRDPDNYEAMISKALGDALTGGQSWAPEGRWIADDTAEHYRLVQTFIAVGRAAETRIELEWWR